MTQFQQIPIGMTAERAVRLRQAWNEFHAAGQAADASTNLAFDAQIRAHWAFQAAEASLKTAAQLCGLSTYAEIQAVAAAA